MKDVRYSVLLALTNISDKAILEAELAPVGAAVVPPSGTSSENGMPSWRGDTRRGKGAGFLLPFAGWIAAALGIVCAVGIMVALIRGGILVNPFGPSPDTDTSTEETTDEPTEEIPFEVWDGTVAKGFARGTGTASDPYIINHPSQLAYLAKLLKGKNSSYASKHYRLEANLDMYRNEWTPIGTGNTAFSGHFDGNGHVIRNLSFSKLTSDEGYHVAGLFGVVKNATIQNLTITDVTFYIKKPDPSYEKIYTGGLAGIILVTKEKTATLSNCKLEKIKNSVVCMDAYYTNHYQGGVIGRISIEEDGQFKGERIQAVDVDLYGNYGNDLYQGLLAGYIRCYARFDLRDVCLEGTAVGHSEGQYHYAALAGYFYSDGANATYRNIFAVNHNVKNLGVFLANYNYEEPSKGYSFYYENCFRGYSYESSSDPTDISYDGTQISYRNCFYTTFLPDKHGFNEQVWDVSDRRHPRLR